MNGIGFAPRGIASKPYGQASLLTNSGGWYWAAGPAGYGLADDGNGGWYWTTTPTYRINLIGPMAWS